MIAMGGQPPATLDLLLLCIRDRQMYRGRESAELMLRSYGFLFDSDRKQQAEARFGRSDVFLQAKSGLWMLSFPDPPYLALGNLSTVCRAAGYSVKVLDNLSLRFRNEQLERVLTEESPRLVGISTQFVKDVDLIERTIANLRELAPAAKIVLGGYTAAHETQLHRLADFVVFGPGEGPLVSLLRVVHGSESVDRVPRIAYRDPDGTVRYTSDASRPGSPLGRKEHRESSSIPDPPIPDWAGYQRYRRCVYPAEFSKGCRYGCSYCANERGKQIRTIPDIASELRANADLGIRRYRFVDSNFTDGPRGYERYPHDICQLIIDLGLDLAWSCYSRSDTIDPELAALLRQAGCFEVFLGVESGDDSILKGMRKAHTARASRDAIQICKEQGILVHANMIVGFPGETEETHNNSVDFIAETQPHTVWWGQLTLDPSAPLLTRPFVDQFEIEGQGLDWSHATMDSNTARALAAEAARWTMKEGVVIGSEYLTAKHLGYLDSMDSYLRLHALYRTIQSPSSSPTTQREARHEVAELMLDVAASNICRDLEVMETLAS